MRITQRFPLLLLLLSLCAVRPASALSLTGFQVAGISAWSGLSNSVFAQVSWTPFLGLGPVGVRGEIGVTGLDFGAGRFVASHYEALLHLPLFPGFALEGGGGVHLWHGVNPAAPALTVNAVLGSPLGLDRFFLGYTRYTGGLGANEVRAGVGFDL
jgi:hypothetical protein